MRNVIAAGAGILLVGAVAHAQSGTTVSRDDRADIHELYARYAHAIDSGDGAGYLGVFTEDGVFVMAGDHPDGGRTLTAAQIAKGARRRERPKITHYYSNIVIDPTPEGARGQVYLLLLDLQKNGTISSGSYCDDTLVKTKDGWRFQRRVCYREPGPPQPAERSARQ